MRALTDRIAFQGNPGAYSHQACVEAFPGLAGLPCESFEAAIAAVRDGRADLAMLPVENSTYGRIADIHHLLPESGLNIIGEHFVRVHANLMALPGTKLEEVKTALSQAPLLGQVRNFLKTHAMKPLVGADTAGSAAAVAAGGRPHRGRRSPPSSRPRSTGSRCWPATSRTSRTTPRASW